MNDSNKKTIKAAFERINKTQGTLTPEEQAAVNELLMDSLRRTSIELAYNYLKQVPPKSATYVIYRYQNADHFSVLEFYYKDEMWHPVLYKEDAELSGIEIPYQYKDILFKIVFVEDFDSTVGADFDFCIYEETVLQAIDDVQKAVMRVLNTPSDIFDEENSSDERDRVLDEACEARNYLRSLFLG